MSKYIFKSYWISSESYSVIFRFFHEELNLMPDRKRGINFTDAFFQKLKLVYIFTGLLLSIAYIRFYHR